MLRCGRRSGFRWLDTSSYEHPLRLADAHREYRVFRGSTLWLERDANYLTKKVDPSEDFLYAVRAGVADLVLLAAPQEMLAKWGAARPVQAFRCL